MSKISHRRIQANGMGSPIAEAGSGPLVLLLHEFPVVMPDTGRWPQQERCALVSREMVEFLRTEATRQEGGNVR